MRALALDLSLTGTAWRAGADEDHAGRWSTDADKISGIRRVRYIRDLIREIIWQEVPDVVLLEGYAYAAANGAHQAGELGGVVRADLDDWLLPWTVVTPQNRAKFATGRSQSKKAEVVSSVAARTGIVFATDDDADVYSLWCMALQAYGVEHPMGTLPKANLESMVTVDWPLTETLTPLYEYKPKPHKPKAKKSAEAK